MASFAFPSARMADKVCAGLDIGPHHVRLALLRRCGRQAQVLRLAQQQTAARLCQDGQIQDFETLALLCRALLDEAATHGNRAIPLALALPAITLRATRLVLPARCGPVQRMQQVRSEMAAHGVERHEHVLDYRELGPPPGSPDDVQVLALAAPALVIEDRMALADALARPLLTLVPEDLCLASWLRDGSRVEHTAVLRLDGAGHWLLHGPGPARLLPPALLARGALAFVAGAAAFLQPLPRRLILCGDHPLLPAIARALRKYAGLEVKGPEAPAALMLSPQLAAQLPPDYHLALALAWEGLA